MSKIDKVYAHLKKGKTLTSWEAITKYQVTRLAAVIFELKLKGYDIKTIMVESDNCRYAKYKMENV